MHPNRLSELVTLKIPAINAWLSCNSGYIAEVLGQCGFDSVTVDLQHGQFGMDVVPSLLQAISSTDAMPLVRCAENSFGDINKILDSGAYDIICPMIDMATASAMKEMGLNMFPPVIIFSEYALKRASGWLNYRNEHEASNPAFVRTIMCSYSVGRTTGSPVSHADISSVDQPEHIHKPLCI